MSELNKNNPDPDYAHLLAEVKERIRSAQYEALKAVNKRRGQVSLCLFKINKISITNQRNT